MNGYNQQQTIQHHGITYLNSLDEIFILLFQLGLKVPNQKSFVSCVFVSTGQLSDSAQWLLTKKKLNFQFIGPHNTGYVEGHLKEARARNAFAHNSTKEA